MSFEGYYQRLCGAGHCMNGDVFLVNDDDKCWCGLSVAWSHLVDQTNDSGVCIELEIDEQIRCEHCDSILQTRYKIPKKQTKAGD